MGCKATKDMSIRRQRVDLKYSEGDSLTTRRWRRRGSWRLGSAERNREGRK